ncbi:hypothetical protein [Oceanispirochaeta sp.]|jgi:hypothetical protein|uniref:hypothetical protein n=1 Tax=Oceanispirochaeta sp. TaxID=2035350 RepID=UPI00260D666B|nr:hypothetical protein [Oceanispirochaeta sp.]MDA3957896.1 hypothetical protein [Oceanispirochaeta sp.]
MGEAQVKEEEQAIVNYIKDHFVDWLEEKKVIPFPPRPKESSFFALPKPVKGLGDLFNRGRRVPAMRALQFKVYGFGTTEADLQL